MNSSQEDRIGKVIENRIAPDQITESPWTRIRVDNMPQHIGNEESRARRRALKSRFGHQIKY